MTREEAMEVLQHTAESYIGLFMSQAPEPERNYPKNDKGWHWHNVDLHLIKQGEGLRVEVYAIIDDPKDSWQDETAELLLTATAGPTPIRGELDEWRSLQHIDELAEERPDLPLWVFAAAIKAGDAGLKKVQVGEIHQKPEEE